MRRLALLLLALAWIPPAAGARWEEVPGEELDVVELVPDDPPSWTPTNLLAPVTGFFLGGGPGYWYDPRVVEIRTTPPGAMLDLFYVRRGFQKRYEQADAPARVILPSRIEATDRDTLTIRALLDGYRQREVQVRVRSREERVMIDLAPLPNTLVAFSHTAFAGRGSLHFLTEEALTFRLQRGDGALSVVLTETAESPEAADAMRDVRSAFVESVRGQQLGEDLVVRVATTALTRSEAFETRSRQSRDPIRGLHRFALDFVPRDGGVANVARARDALARLGPDSVTGCALRFDESLREQLDPAALARALSPTGAYTDRYLRAAMRRLGELSPDGRIRMLDGSRFDASQPIELMAAATQPGEALGYLALLRDFVARLEPEDQRRAALRSLIAPELSPARFEAVLAEASRAERACRGPA